MSIDEIGLWAGFVLTLMVFSYILGDNILYRLAVSVFVGLAAGYIAIVTVESVLIPWFDSTIATTDPASFAVGLFPIVLGLLLLLKTTPRLARLGNLGIAFVIGVGAAVAIVGAVTGSLIPLGRSISTLGAEVDSDNERIDSVLIVVGVICSLLYFQYIARRTPQGVVMRGRVGRLTAGVGKGFIVVTLGALYAAAIITSLTIFSERIAFILTQINGG